MYNKNMNKDKICTVKDMDLEIIKYFLFPSWHDLREN